ncbi:methyltransferase domain-containing protein [Ferrovibrio sp.]|uniref:methyltransferase domain-containing protein n=1 Tax=Ferrovibrio sp. TaxID=1917215 RepID=UPI000CB0AA86|nr:methyltransferase domain-containing protein [Ferrovibrio sp.]PJI42283.1 MAG: SAM-dependent methyltransferase [Ferrovibrio sp.]
MSDTMQVFDRTAKRRQRQRVSGRAGDFDFLRAAVAERLLDRLDDIRRSFPLALVQGCDAAWLQSQLGARGQVERLVSMDSVGGPGAHLGLHAVGDEEFLPFAEGRFDLVIALLNLHWVNDLPGALIQIRRVLKPDGLFLGAMLGGSTLNELRQSWLAAEAEIEGGASPRVSPMAETLDGAALLQRAGFALPVADSEIIPVSYGDAFGLMRDLRGMGETNAILGRRKAFTRRTTLLRMVELYQQRFAGPDGRIPATFEMIALTGWSPHESQQKPLRPGQATHRLADALGTVAHPIGGPLKPN